MNKLKLSHITPYRNHKLKFVMICDHTEEFDFEEWDGDTKDFKEGSIWQYAGEIDSDLYIPLGDGDISRVFRKGSQYISIISKGMKPILRQLSKETLIELFKNYEQFEILHFSENAIQIRFKVMGEYLDYRIKISGNFDICQKWIIDIFNENYVDYFGLIDDGLAIDINTLD